MKFIIDGESMVGYDSIIVDIYYSKNWISRHFISSNKSVEEFIESYIDECKLEMLSLRSEWMVACG